MQQVGELKGATLASLIEPLSAAPPRRPRRKLGAALGKPRQIGRSRVAGSRPRTLEGRKSRIPTPHAHGTPRPQRGYRHSPATARVSQTNKARQAALPVPMRLPRAAESAHSVPRLPRHDRPGVLRCCRPHSGCPNWSVLPLLSGARTQPTIIQVPGPGRTPQAKVAAHRSDHPRPSAAEAWSGRRPAPRLELGPEH